MSSPPPARFPSGRFATARSPNRVRPDRGSGSRQDYRRPAQGRVPDVNANAFKDFLAGKDIPSRTTALLNAASAIVADGNLVGNGTLAERFAEATSWPRKPSIPARPKPCSTSGSKPPSPRRDMEWVCSNMFTFPSLSTISSCRSPSTSIRDLSWLDRNYGRDTPAIHWFAISHTSPTNSPLGCLLNGSASERGAKDHTAYASYTLAPSS